MIVTRRHLYRCAAVFWLALAPVQLTHAQTESQHQFVFFPGIDTFDTFSESSDVVDDSFERLSADVLYSYSNERFRFLAEYLWSSSESELERLQAGWQLNDNSLLWFGRVHSPARYWMSEFHHGQFLQTSITRPSLEEWEDENGSTPSHITGVMLESDKYLDGEAAINYVISAGLAPKFKGEELMPFDMLDPESGHGLSVNLRVGYQPSVFGPLKLGLVASWNEIDVVPDSNPALLDLDTIDQFSIGFYGDWQWEKLRLISSVVYYDHNIKSVNGTESDRFILGYLQPEYQISEDVTIFGRIDNAGDEDNSTYLRLLPGFVSHRHMIGARWDFRDDQSLKFEIAETSQQGEGLGHDHYKELRFQWCAVFP